MICAENVASQCKCRVVLALNGSSGGNFVLFATAEQAGKGGQSRFGRSEPRQEFEERYRTYARRARKLQPVQRF